MKEMKKSNLDERQEQILLRIEHNGFWLAFWLLVIAMVVQNIVSGSDLKVFAGECIILLIISLYVVIECIRNGIWDRKLKPKASNNLLASALAGLGMGVVTALALIRYFPDMPLGLVAVGVFAGVFTFVLCMIALTVSMRFYRKRNEKMEEEPEDNEDIILNDK
jgi:putative Mn2+ efflux pump MntP